MKKLSSIFKGYVLLLEAIFQKPLTKKQINNLNKLSKSYGTRKV